MIGTFTRKTEPYQKCPSSQPLATGPIAPAAPVTPAQIAIAFVRSCGGEHVHEDRQRRRHDERGAAPHQRAAGDELPHRRRSGCEQHAEEEADEPELQRALAPEPVAERAGSEEQPREHERVGGDDPLQLRRRGVEVARQRRDGDVQARVADEDDQQAQAQDAERPPTTGVEGRHVHDPPLLRLMPYDTT